MARHLKARGGWLHLTVITNGLRIADGAGRVPGHHRRHARRLPPLGGAEPRRAVGRWAVRQDRHPRAFLGAAGFALETGLSDATEEEAQIKRL